MPAFFSEQVRSKHADCNYAKYFSERLLGTRQIPSFPRISVLGAKAPSKLVFEVRLAAAGRLRSAVALELVAGKVWALLDAVQSARGIHRRNGTGSPCMG